MPIYDIDDYDIEAMVELINEGMVEAISEMCIRDRQCIYENEINQRAMAGRKVAQMQEPEQAAENAADMGDMKEEQNGTIMQGM